jgi:hypothetical protein
VIIFRASCASVVLTVGPLESVICLENVKQSVLKLLRSFANVKRSSFKLNVLSQHCHMAGVP